MGTAGCSGRCSTTIERGTGWTRTASKSRLMIPSASAKRFILRTFILKRACSATIATSRRTITVTEKSTGSRGPRLPVDFSVTVIVLREVAIVALHALFKMNVRKMNRFAEALGIIKRDLLAVLVQPVPLSIVVEHRPEHPA